MWAKHIIWQHLLLIDGAGALKSVGINIIVLRYIPFHTWSMGLHRGSWCIHIYNYLLDRLLGERYTAFPAFNFVSVYA